MPLNGYEGYNTLSTICLRVCITHFLQRYIDLPYSSDDLGWTLVNLSKGNKI